MENEIDLTKDNFLGRLENVLNAIAIADFVAIDFEFSGIPTRLQTQSNAPATKETKPVGKQTVQQRYEEMKAAAEKYHILQIGLTIGAQSESGKSYFLEPYNIHLNPCIVHKMDIDRDITMLGSSMQFLTMNNFQVNKPFTDGVVYLSRQEQEDAIRLESDRLDGSSYTDIMLDHSETGFANFVDVTRKRLNNFAPKHKDDSVMIDGGSPGVRLTSFQRRLIHQLVRSEFPGLITITVSDNIKVIAKDEKREAKMKQVRMDAFMSRVSRQIGFRHVMEAMVGGDLTTLDETDMYMKPGQGWLDMNAARAKLASLQAELKARRPVLVGHNMFLDLIFLYKTFFGPLPDKVEDFAKVIHSLFPLVVDTKFLCTHSSGLDNTSLLELTQDLHLQELPRVTTRTNYRRYENTAAHHEAGYDAWQTARLLIKTAGKLVARTTWQRAVQKPTKPGTSRPVAPGSYQSPLSSPESIWGDSEDLIDMSLGSRKETDKNPVYGPSIHSCWQFALAHFGPNASKDQQAEVPEDMLPLEQFHMLPKPCGPRGQDPHSFPEPGPDAKLPEWMPVWNSDFWVLFGNKIRINGTKEALLDLLATKDSVKVDGDGSLG